MMKSFILAGALTLSVSAFGSENRKLDYVPLQDLVGIYKATHCSLSNMQNLVVSVTKEVSHGIEWLQIKKVSGDDYFYIPTKDGDGPVYRLDLSKWFPLGEAKMEKDEEPHYSTKDGYQKTKHGIKYIYRQHVDTSFGSHTYYTERSIEPLKAEGLIYTSKDHGPHFNIKDTSCEFHRVN
jgi:hypothetical protein